MTGRRDATPAVSLRSVEDGDIDVFFEHQQDPEAVGMAVFPQGQGRLRGALGEDPR